jgi:hypothetical protein
MLRALDGLSPYFSRACSDAFRLDAAKKKPPATSVTGGFSMRFRLDA